MMKQNPFPRPLCLIDSGMIEGTRVFTLEKDFLYKTFAVPAGFQTNGISSPKWTWPLVGPVSDAFPAAVFHDYFYSKGCQYDFTRKEADDLFLVMMKELGLGFFQRQAIYRAVRLFGWTCFKKD
jgi:hypothetical protein